MLRVISGLYFPLVFCVKVIHKEGGSRTFLLTPSALAVLWPAGSSRRRCALGDYCLCKLAWKHIALSPC